MKFPRRRIDFYQVTIVCIKNCPGWCRYAEYGKWPYLEAGSGDTFSMVTREVTGETELDLRMPTVFFVGVRGVAPISAVTVLEGETFKPFSGRTAALAEAARPREAAGVFSALLNGRAPNT